MVDGELDATTQAQVAEFEAQGYCVIPDGLAADEVRAMKRAIAHDRAAHPGCWELRGMDHHGNQQGEVGEKGRWQSELLPRTTAFDDCTAHPAVVPLVRHIMGPEMRFAWLSVMVRAPVPEPVPPGQHAWHQLWHRESGGATDPSHPYHIDSIMVLFYLDAAVEGGHGFSVVGESLEQKRAHKVKPTPNNGWQIDEPFVGQSQWSHAQRDDAVDVLGDAGTIIVTHGSNPHAGTVRQSDSEFAKVLVWYGLGAQRYFNSSIGRTGPKRVPHHSGHGDKDGTVPRRLLDRKDIGWVFEDSLRPRDGASAASDRPSGASPAAHLPNPAVQPELAAEEWWNAHAREAPAELREAYLREAEASFAGFPTPKL